MQRAAHPSPECEPDTTLPMLTADDRAAIRPFLRGMLAAGDHWLGVLGVPLSDADVDTAIDWLWSRPDERPALRAALDELRHSREHGEAGHELD